MFALLMLIGAANTGPLVANKLLAERWTVPIDGGVVLADGAPLFGRSKTLRGLLIGILAPTLAAPVLGHSLVDGALIGSGAMAGDLLSSFCKRRMKLAPSSRASGLDQIPEALLPAWLVRDAFGLSIGELVLVVIAFFGFEIALSKLAFHFHLRDRPY
jgi:CDP-archaeol synthase